MVVPQAHLQRNKRHSGFHEPPRAHEGFPIPGHRAGGMGIHELIAARPVAIQRLGLLLAQVERPARFAGRQHIQSLTGKRLESSHFAAGIDVAPQVVQVRQQFLPAPSAATNRSGARAPAFFKPWLFGTKARCCDPDPERLFRLRDLLVIPFQAHESRHARCRAAAPSG